MPPKRRVPPSRVRFQGYQEGFDYAEEIYRVDFRCSVCSALLPVDHDTAKRDASDT